MKNSKLIVEYDYGFEACSFTSSVKPHKLAWNINQALKINMTKADDLLFEFIKEKSKLYFINYKFETEYSYFRLIKNKACEYYNTLKPYLIPELKDYDYLVLCSNANATSENCWKKSLRSVPEIEFISEIDIENLKSKENLIF